MTASVGALVALAVFSITVLWIDPAAPTSGAHGGLTINLAPQPSVGYSPLDVDLIAAVSGGDPPYTVTWTDGNSLIGSGASSLYQFTEPGNYTVRATAVDAAGTNASATTTLVIVSPLPEAVAFVPAQGSVNTDTLAISWRASGPTSSCVLASWGTLGVPPFAKCGTDGGLTQGARTSESVVFQVNPDDPEISPALFQSSQSGVLISLDWWFNDTTVTEQSGAISVMTAVSPL